MCGYIQLVTDSPHVQALLIEVGLDDLVPDMVTDTHDILHSYPAFGGIPRYLHGLIHREGDRAVTSDAIWWYDCQAEGENVLIGDRTTFNARNLESNYWKGAIRHKRALVVATGFGETGNVGGKKKHYLLESHRSAILLGAVYRRLNSSTLCCAIITRPASKEFARYHEKAMPLMLPGKASVIHEWLDQDIEQSPIIDDLLENPTVIPALRITQVKTFKSAEKITGTEVELVGSISSGD
ncbi:MAG: SOS response-associated peptidase family protein [Candidatus Thiodiazotropha sp.]